jgi:hypothetical protein
MDAQSRRRASHFTFGPRLNPLQYQLEHTHYIPNTYLGYSVEPACRDRPFIPHDLRAKPPQAYVLAKKFEYFDPKSHTWTAEFYDNATIATGVHFIVGADGDAPLDFPQSLENVGLMDQGTFFQMLSQSAVLVGMGLPYT